MVGDYISRLIDLTGKRYGRLIVIGRNISTGRKETMWDCKCDCGNIVTVLGSSLKRKMTKSCGCLHRDIVIATKRKTCKYDLDSYDYGVGWTTNTGIEFYFDKEDFDTIKDYCWYENDQGYICSREHFSDDKTIRMHRLLTDFKYKFVDHKNTKRYDNRKSNLRECDKQTNGINRIAGKNNKLGIKGISKIGNGYFARVCCGDKVFSKYDTNLDSLIKWHDDKEKEIYGEFSYTHNKEET